MDGIAQQALDAFDDAVVLALGWLFSPAARSQFALLVVAYLLAVVATRVARPRFAQFLTPDAQSETPLARIRRFVLLFLPLLLPLFAYAFTALGEQVTRQLFGSGAVIAFGKGVFLFLAARILVLQIITDPFLRFLGRFVLVPVAALYALGILDDITRALSNSVIELGNISFSAMALLRGLIAGSLLFWFGMWSNSQSSRYIDRQPMRPAIRQLSIKAAQINGIDDGKNKYSSEALFLMWNALKAHDIEIPYPHRVVEIKGPRPETLLA